MTSATEALLKDDFADAVVRGLSQPRKVIPARYLYDRQGSELFEAITTLPCLEVDARSLSRDLGVPAIPITARTGEGVHTLLATVAEVIEGQVATKPIRVNGTPEFQKAVHELAAMIEQMSPGIPNARWLAIRLLDGDARVQQAITSGELNEIVARQQRADVQFSGKMSVEGRQ